MCLLRYLSLKKCFSSFGYFSSFMLFPEKKTYRNIKLRRSNVHALLSQTLSSSIWKWNFCKILIEFSWKYASFRVKNLHRRNSGGKRATRGIFPKLSGFRSIKSIKISLVAIKKTDWYRFDRHNQGVFESFDCFMQRQVMRHQLNAIPL